MGDTAGIEEQRSSQSWRTSSGGQCEAADFASSSHGEQQVDCDFIQQELGMMLAETYRADAFGTAFPEIRDLDGWKLVSKPDAEAEPKVCLKCQHPCHGHSPLPRGNSPTVEEWEKYRKTIEDLYITRNLSPEEVRVRMCKSFGFVAT